MGRRRCMRPSREERGLGLEVGRFDDLLKERNKKNEEIKNETKKF